MAAILVIDAYDGFREAMSYCLPQFGHVALVAVDREEALRIAKENEVDIVLLDLGYRQQTGFLVCAALKRHERLKETPVILMGDTVTTGARERAQACGAETMIAKPIEWPEFLALVDRLAPPATTRTPDDSRTDL
jgi:CheY-like chemotaxis protein